MPETPELAMPASNNIADPTITRWPVVLVSCSSGSEAPDLAAGAEAGLSASDKLTARSSKAKFACLSTIEASVSAT